MNIEQLKELLKKANLSKKDLADLLGVTYQTVNCWGTTQNIPYWVESWLTHYIKSKKFEKISDMIKNEL